MGRKTAARLFIYEHLTGGGLHAHHDVRYQSLAAEGQAMVSALASDFAALEGIEVTCLRDLRAAPWHPPGCRIVDVNSADECHRQFDRLAADSDWTVVIAPEIDGLLLDCCRRVVELGGRLLGPPLELIALASDKQRTIECLQAAGVPTPQGRPFDTGDAWPRDFRLPAIWKPRDGAGSQDLLVICDRRSLPDLPAGKSGRLEESCSGTAASIAMLCGPIETIFLPGCRQHLSDDGRLRYLGGSLPLSSELAERATRLGERAVAALPNPLGYLGVDLVLGESADGSDDVVIEINPRLTTSYLGLRALCRQNLADAMLCAALGEPVTLSFESHPLQFTPTGETTPI